MRSESHNSILTKPSTSQQGMISDQHQQRGSFQLTNSYNASEECMKFNELSIENFKKSSRNQCKMATLSVTLNEMNANLWEKALMTSIADINIWSYPHILIVQKLINHTMNSKFIDIGLTTCFFSKLILFHQPNTKILQDYFWSIINDKYLMLNSPNEESDYNAFWRLIDILVQFANDECMKDFIVNETKEAYKNSKIGSLEFAASLKDRILIDEDNVISICEEENIFFGSLSKADQLQRVFIILEFLYSILQADYRKRKNENNCKLGNEFCFLASLLWENADDAGSVNDKVKKLISIWFALEKADFCHFLTIHRKLMTLLFEIISNIGNVQKFQSDNLDAFKSEICLKFNDCLKENMTAIRMLKPHRLRMMVCSKLLSRLTGKSCPAELIAVHDILEYIVKVKGKVFSRRSERSKSIKDINHGDCYCKFEDSKLDCNSFNEKGWTPLHEAVLNGHQSCVTKLLKQKFIDVKRKGANGLTPLMCAVATNQTKICASLMKHSGHNWMNDLDANGRSAIDFCASEEIAALLTGISIATEDAESVVELCIRLAESYIIANGIWESRKRLLRKRKQRESSGSCESDIYARLEKLVPELERLKELKRFAEPFRRMLNFKNYS